MKRWSNDIKWKNKGWNLVKCDDGSIYGNLLKRRMSHSVNMDTWMSAKCSVPVECA